MVFALHTGQPVYGYDARLHSNMSIMVQAGVLSVAISALFSALWLRWANIKIRRALHENPTGDRVTVRLLLPPVGVILVGLLGVFAMDLRTSSTSHAISVAGVTTFSVAGTSLWVSVGASLAVIAFAAVVAHRHLLFLLSEPIYGLSRFKILSPRRLLLTGLVFIVTALTNSVSKLGDIIVSVFT